MMRDFDNSPPSIFNKGVWIPSENLVRKAELRLPTALDQISPEPKVIRRFYVPQYYTPKGATPVASPGHQRVEDNIADSLEDNFLYEVEPLLSNYKRQYLGVTYKGKKYLLISFIDGFYITGDAELKEEWRRRWIAVLDGGDAFWNVLYDPATEKFSEWECNGTG